MICNDADVLIVTADFQMHLPFFRIVKAAVDVFMGINEFELLNLPPGHFQTTPDSEVAKDDFARL